MNTERDGLSFAAPNKSPQDKYEIFSVRGTDPLARLPRTRGGKHWATRGPPYRVHDVAVWSKATIGGGALVLAWRGPLERVTLSRNSPTIALACAFAALFSQLVAHT